MGKGLINSCLSLKSFFLFISSSNDPASKFQQSLLNFVLILVYYRCTTDTLSHTSDTGMLRLIQEYHNYSCGCTSAMATGGLRLQLHAYFSYGYGHTTAAATGVLLYLPYCTLTSRARRPLDDSTRPSIIIMTKLPVLYQHTPVVFLFHVAITLHISTINSFVALLTRKRRVWTMHRVYHHWHAERMGAAVGQFPRVLSPVGQTTWSKH